MKHTIIFFHLLILLFYTSALAEEPAPNNNIGFRANFKRISLDLSNTSVKNAKEYQTSPVSAFNANDEAIIKGTLDFALEYEKLKWRWDNKVYAKYGKTTIEDLDGVKTKSETDDEIIFTSDIFAKIFKQKQFDIGPFANAEYQTEFTRNLDAPRNQVVRGRLGIKAINGAYIPEIYLTNVVESDFTYSKTVDKYAVEFGLTMEHEYRTGVKFKIEGYYRDYILFSYYNPNDLKYDINFTARMDVNITKILNVSPFISFRQGKARGAENYARNTMIGISLLYKDLFNIW